MYGYLPLLLSVFEWLSVPTIFLIFWLTMFMGQLHHNIAHVANIRALSKVTPARSLSLFPLTSVGPIFPQIGR